MMTDPHRRHADPHPQRRQRARHAHRRLIPSSKLKLRRRASVLEASGYVHSASHCSGAEERARPHLRVGLRYRDDGREMPFIDRILKRVSAQPSRRVYVGAEEIPKVRNRHRHQRCISTLEGRDDGSHDARAQKCWAAKSSARSGSHVANRKAGSRSPRWGEGRDPGLAGPGDRPEGYARRAPPGLDRARARRGRPAPATREREERDTCRSRARSRARFEHGDGRDRRLLARARDSGRRVPSRSGRQDAQVGPRLLSSGGHGGARGPQGVSVQESRIRIEGIDKQQVGQFAAEIRRLRPPEPYKGKGIRYVNEQVRRKVGKAGTA